MSKRRKFSAEFKREAVQLAMTPGATLRGVAQDLGLNENLLSRWKKEILANGDSAFLGQGHARDQELMRLRRELAKVKKERDFLAEAAAYFAKGPK
jgi:transposase